MKKEQLPPDIERSYPANYRLCRVGSWRFEKETPFAYKKGEKKELCHIGSKVLLENLETKGEIPGRIAGIYQFNLVKYHGKPGRMASFLLRVKTDEGEEILYPMWQRPKDLFLKDAETGRNFHLRA